MYLTVKQQLKDLVKTDYKILRLFIGVLTVLVCVCLAGCGYSKIEKNESSEVVSTEMRSEEEKTDDVVNEPKDITESDESVSDTDYVDVSGITHPFGSINGVELTDQVNYPPLKTVSF